MSLKVLGLIVATLVNLVIGTYVLCKGPKKTVNRSLSLFLYALSVWSFCNLAVTVSRDVRWVTIFGHWCFAIGVLLPVTFLYFCIIFPKPPPEHKKLKYGLPALNYVVVITGGLLFLLSFTKFIQEDVYLLNGVFRPKPGPLYPLFVAYEIGGVSLGLFYLFKKWRATKAGIEATQLKIVFTGLLIGTSLPVVVDAILPALGFPQLVSIGPTFTVIIVGFIAYSIVRYRLFEITVVVKETAIYALFTTFITALYIISFLLAQKLFRGIVGHQTFLPALFAGFVIAFAFLRLRGRIQNFLDKVFYAKKYEYQKVLRETGRELARVLSLPRILDMILKNITESVGIEKASIWLEERGRYSIGSQIGLTDKEREVSLRKNSSLVKWMKRRKDVVIRQELERLHLPEKITETDEALRNVGAEIAIPILRKKDLMGIIFLSAKVSGDIFTQDDIDLFLGLANQASVAIDNAKLYTRMEETKVYQENILRNLTGGVITTDKKGKIVIFNQKAQELTGFPSEVIGKSFKHIAKGVMGSLIEDTLRSGEGYEQREVNYVKEKDVFTPLAMSTAPLKDATGEVTGAIVVLVDLTEIKRLEQELYQAEKLASLGTLAAGMAHEIKNPLVAINTFLQLFPTKFNDEQFREKFSGVVAEEAKRINEIVEQMLDFAQPRPVNYQSINIHKVLDGTLAFLSTELNKRSIRIVKNYADEARDIYADQDRLKQVFLNLFLNGIESMDGGGTLTVNTSYNHQAKGGLISEGKELVIEIKDTGKGIPSDIMSKIFDPFFSTKENGTGLGLATVHRIIADHGGTIKAKETNPRKGACFSLHLPVNKEKPEEESSSGNKLGRNG